MNNRIAKKILTCKSSLSNAKESVIAARQHVRCNPEYFKNKGIYLLPISIDPKPCNGFVVR